MNAAEKFVELELETVPNSKEFAVAGFNPWTKALRVKVSSKALRGRANEEIVEELGKLFCAKTRIVSGWKNRRKKVVLEGVSFEDVAGIVGKT